MLFRHFSAYLAMNDGVAFSKCFTINLGSFSLKLNLQIPDKFFPNYDRKNIVRTFVNTRANVLKLFTAVIYECS
jgi:hypothetical protein